jgi:hypothetical protein
MMGISKYVPTWGAGLVATTGNQETAPGITHINS